MNPNRPGIVLAIALFATLGFTLFAGSPSRAGIRVVKIKSFTVQEDKYSVAMERIQMHLYPVDDYGLDDSMDIKIDAPGTIDNTQFNPTGDFLTNKARTLVAFDLNQLDTNQVFLVVQDKDGVLVMREFGDRVWDLCKRAHHPEFNGDMADVTKIVGDTVYVVAPIMDDSEDKYSPQNACIATVHVAPDGQLSLTGYRLTKVEGWPTSPPIKR